MENQGLYLTEFQSKLLLKRLQSDLRLEYRRRIEIMLLADAGKSQTEICESLKCSAETARYWIHVAQSGQAHLWDSRPMGRPKKVTPEYLHRLAELVQSNPKEYGYPFRRWTAPWLSKHMAKEFGLEVSDRHIHRLLKQMGLSNPRSSNLSNQPSDTAAAGSTITIRDLQAVPNPNFLWSLNLIQSRR
ncbi:helix-turn-helix domain-containing protein [Oculatella sp. LEGE 06141]|uniref:helix-turn-helix domain-containing protein n=1 Tax=Oculatella sp. LEGE 06141 TaxID=1828648 RepID=UPI0030DA7F06